MKKAIKRQSISKLAQQLIIDNINGEAYDKTLKTDREKVKFLHETFMSEVGKWRIPQIGIQTALKYWFQGLPTACTIPFYNYDIIKIAINWGSLTKKHTEKQAEKILNNYWDFMVNHALKLFNKRG